MIKREVIEKIINYFNIPQYEAERIYNDFFSFIIQGVRDEKFVNIQGFGEFILKENGNESSFPIASGPGYKKTVDFLSSSSLTEELSSGVYEALKSISPPVPQPQNIIVPDDKEKELPKSSLEEELKQKREALLKKISIHPLQDSSVGGSTEKQSKTLKTPPQITSVQEPQVTDTSAEQKEQPITGVTGDVHAGKESEPQKVQDEDYLQSGDELSKKSFSDFFAEVDKESSTTPGSETLEMPSVIPKSAVDLHKEIISAPVPLIEQKEEVKPDKVLETDVVSKPKTEDKSYYIWYKDSEPDPEETLNLSYEYELLYQATKEAEYKSKLKIYVTSFILFFSIVLVLLIFSPVFYKFFFTPVEYPVNVQEETPEQKASPNVLQPPQTSEQTTSTKTDTAGRQITQSNITQQPQQTESKQNEAPQQQVQQTVQNEEPKTDGLTKNTMGWIDDKNKVVYVKLDNGKYSIQESSFDSEAKAMKRITAVEAYNIPGIKGTSVKSDLGAKGIWFRVRFGEFQTIEEARTKAGELRSKVKI